MDLLPVQIILSTVDAEYGFLCAKYGEKSRADPRELRVEIIIVFLFVYISRLT